MSGVAAVVRGTLHCRDGQPCTPVPFEGRRLGEAELDAVIALHRLVLAGMPAHLVAAETNAFFADHMSRIGRTLGLFAEDRLIAYGVLGLPGPADPNFADDLGLAATERARVAHIDGIGVRPEWRGNRLQRVLTAWRIREAVLAGRSLVITTVAPGNGASLRNILAEGLTIRALRQKYGGWRYLMVRDLNTPVVPPPDGGRWIDAADVITQEHLLAAGSIGWKAESAEAGMRVWFAPAAET
ncbi:MAG: hypothetical protein IH626_10010 [Rhodospirillales bacterium]|nr:hypothetical protein [Rhodospirillales bacterium]